MNKKNEVFFWSVDMVIVRDLTMDTIKSAAPDLIETQQIELACEKIDTIESVYPDIKSFDEIIEGL